MILKKSKKNYFSKTSFAIFVAIGAFFWCFQIKAHFLKAMNSFPEINATLAKKLPVLKYEYVTEDKDYYDFIGLIERTVPKDARILFIGPWHSWGVKFRYHLYPFIIEKSDRNFIREKMLKKYDYVILYAEGIDALNKIKKCGEYLKEIFVERSTTKMTKAIFSLQTDGKK
ncbi:MAG: hypothetical protein ACW97P_00700 [Candidatus Hodarchaeales archaeon]|jgi:hypothetical protein